MTIFMRKELYGAWAVQAVVLWICDML